MTKTFIETMLLPARVRDAYERDGADGIASEVWPEDVANLTPDIGMN